MAWQVRKEIRQILPRRDMELVSNSGFSEFQEQVRSHMPPEPKPQAQPTLIPPDIFGGLRFFPPFENREGGSPASD
jgi:hypothetical protein